MNIGKIIAVYGSGFFVVIALVLFPASGNILLDKAYHGFTEAEYGTIFLPQIIFATLSSLSAPKIAQKIGMKKVLLLGLVGIITSMVLLIASNWFMEGTQDYLLIMLATGFLGTGFGFSVTALNPFAYNLFPGKETTALTALHTLMGLGASAASLVLTFFVGLKYWWGAPAMVVVIMTILVIFTLSITLELPAASETETEEKGSKGIPFRIWLFALAVFLYGACEATFGNFGSVLLQKEGGLNAANAAIGLSLLWAGVTAGRVLFAVIALKYSTKWLYIITPFILASVFFIIPSIEGKSLLLTFMVLGGLSLSFLFPNSIGAATNEFPKHASLISGLLVASFQIGTGFSSNIIGFLSDDTKADPVSLGSLYQFSTIYALAFGLIVLYLMTTKKLSKA